MPRPIVVVGAGGHGRETAEIVSTAHAAGLSAPLAGFIDDSPDLHGTRVDDQPVFGGLSWLEAHSADVAVVIAVGRPSQVRRIAERLRAVGVVFARAISPQAQVSRRATIGHGVIIFPQVVVGPSARVAAHAMLNVGVSVSHDSVIGQYSSINPGARIAGDVVVGEGCYIGMGAHIIHAQTVGPWTTVGAGAVVIAPIPAGVVAVGVPARIVAGRGAV